MNLQAVVDRIRQVRLRLYGFLADSDRPPTVLWRIVAFAAFGWIALHTGSTVLAIIFAACAVWNLLLLALLAAITIVIGQFEEAVNEILDEAEADAPHIFVRRDDA